MDFVTCPLRFIIAQPLLGIEWKKLPLQLAQDFIADVLQVPRFGRFVAGECRRIELAHERIANLPAATQERLVVTVDLFHKAAAWK